MLNWAKVCLFASFLETSNAKIVKDGLWTNNDFEDLRESENAYNVENGQATFWNPLKARRVKSANMKQFGEFESIYSQPNVKLVSSLFS